MATALILYNYCTSLISQEKAYVYLEEFLDVLEEKGVDVNTIQLQDGNKLYPSTHKLIREIMDFWYKRSLTGKILLKYIHASLCFLEKHLNNELKDKDYFIFGYPPESKAESESICSSLKSFLGSEKIQPAFFNSVIISGNLYNLKKNFGFAINPNSDSGGICLNASLEKKSIWHETAHMLGADDHYAPETEECICPTGKNCLMAWNSLDMNFCQHSICEMQKYLNSRK